MNLLRGIHGGLRVSKWFQKRRYENGNGRLRGNGFFFEAIEMNELLKLASTSNHF